MRSRFVAGALALVVVLAACERGDSAAPPLDDSSAPCRDTGTAGPLGTVRYRDLVFADVLVTCDVEYKDARNADGEDQSLTLDLYAPADDTVVDRPAVLWLTHGGFAMSEKEVTPHPEYAAALARAGYVVAVVEYRIRAGTVFSYAPPFGEDLLDAAADALADAQDAVRWVRAGAGELGIDPDRLAVVGISAGGMTALGVNYSESDDAGVAAAISLEGCALDLTVIDADDGPALLVHSTDDEAVPYTCAATTAATALSVGAVAVLDTRTAVPPFYHGFTNVPANGIVAVLQFLYTNLAPS
jgi:acetyl esterase/lipase